MLLGWFVVEEDEPDASSLFRWQRAALTSAAYGPRGDAETFGGCVDWHSPHGGVSGHGRYSACSAIGSVGLLGTTPTATENHHLFDNGGNFGVDDSTINYAVTAHHLRERGRK